MASNENGTEMNSSPIAELWPEPNARIWFCLRTHLKHEHIAAGHLGRIPGIEVFNPQLRLLRSTRRGRKCFVESLFPNYVFASFDLATMLDRVTYTPGVKMVLRFGGLVPEIRNEVIQDMRQELAGISSSLLTDAPTEGDEVEIAGGAFAGMKASVTRVLPAQQRAQILLEVMGRPVPAELSLDLVLFNRRNAAQIALPALDLPYLSNNAVVRKCNATTH